jgi:hypothetical protein
MSKKIFYVDCDENFPKDYSREGIFFKSDKYLDANYCIIPEIDKDLKGVVVDIFETGIPQHKNGIPSNGDKCLFGYEDDWLINIDVHWNAFYLDMKLEGKKFDFIDNDGCELLAIQEVIRYSVNEARELLKDMEVQESKEK